MTIEEHRPRRRAIAEQIQQARAGRAAVAPLLKSLDGWHRTYARLAADADHRLRRRLPISDLRREVEELANLVVEQTEAWQGGLTVVDTSGHVSDIEKSVRALLATLDALRERLG